MTAPDIGAYASLTAKSIAANARRLGLTWTISPATVQSYDAASGLASVIFDGDVTELMTTSLTGALSSGDRVMVMTVPPSSNYVIGPIGSQSRTGDVVGYDSSTANSASITAETIISTIVTNRELRTGRCYEVQTTGHFVANTLAVPVLNTMGALKVRRNNLAGAVCFDQRTTVLTALGFFISQYMASQFQVSSTGVATLVLTLASNTATPVLDIASATAVRWFKVVDIGNADDFSNLPSI
jgi:hypothetical protein